MAPSRKSPTHPMAAMLPQAHPSPATWVVFEKIGPNQFLIDNIGRFMTDFHVDPFRWGELKAIFRACYDHPYFGQTHSEYSPARLGLLPCETFPRFLYRPPTDQEAEDHFYFTEATRDPRDPYSFWSEYFIVKLQHAHKVMGCTPEEFRRIHLAEFYRGIELEARNLFWMEEGEERQATAEEASEPS